MVKITKASLDELAQQLPLLTEMEQASCVGGLDTTSPWFSKGVDHEQSLGLATLGNDLLSTQVGNNTDNLSSFFDFELDEHKLSKNEVDLSLLNEEPQESAESNEKNGRPPKSKRVLDSGCFRPYDPKDPSGCLRLCDQIVDCAGFHKTGERIKMMDNESGVYGLPSDSFGHGMTVINKELEAGRPVILGVGYDKYPNASSPNLDGVTQHFIVLSGFHTNSDGTRVYDFFDPRTNNRKAGTSGNTLVVKDGVLKGSYQGQLDYTVTTVRPVK